MDLLSARLKAARKEKGLTQEALAERVGIDQSFISRLERGEKNVSTQVLARIASELGMSLSQLVGDFIAEDGEPYDRDDLMAKILADPEAPEGLQSLAADRELVSVLRITSEEWRILYKMPLPKRVSKEGYLQLLITLRVIIG